MKINGQLLNDLYWDDDEGFDLIPRIKGMPQKRGADRNGNLPRHPRKVETQLYEQFDNLRRYDFTYEAARHEEWWLLDSLGPFYDEQWFDDVLRIIKGGKEASVYLCKANPTAETRLLAAKVYRPRSLRNLRNDHLYREGRSRLDHNGLVVYKDRQARAMKNRTAYGQELMHTSWIEHEFRTMKILHEAGCDIPTPYASDHNAIIMDFIGNEHMGAPTLNEISLDPAEAQILFERVIHNLELMLAHQRVHGDFSAYNILYWGGEITLIDFPQAINPNKNPNAYPIFQRDIVRICEYFAAQGVDSNPTKLANELWSVNNYNTMPNYLWPDEEEDQEEKEPMIQRVNIRAEQKSDYEEITNVNDLAFGRPEEGNLVDHLRKLPEFDPRLSLVAEINGKIIGHALFYPTYIHGEDGEEYPCLSLGPIAVIPKYQKQGIGGRLIEAGHLSAMELGYTSIVLLGHPSYYPNFGYQPAKHWNLTNPWDFSDDPWMAIELVEGSLSGKA
ncbi:GNAT family N-acetyltransferase, partial [Chloroflexota bacterium]